MCARSNVVSGKVFFGGLLTGPGVMSPGVVLRKRPRNCFAIQRREMFAIRVK